MKSFVIKTKNRNISQIINFANKLFFVIFILSTPFLLMGQDVVKEKKVHKKVRPTFESIWLIDNQSVMTNTEGTLQMDIQHRFGTLNNGYDDLFGIFAPSNIRIGFSYGITDKLMVGFGITKFKFLWDVNAKYAILTQTRDNYIPISITYYGNMAIDSREETNFDNSSDRLSYFNQIIFARKFNRNLSIQVSPTLSHFNTVPGYLNEDGEKVANLKNTHFAVSTSARYMMGSTAIIFGYDQPVTKHHRNNPHPNLSLGLELNTSAHAFQIFVSNYYNIIPQQNNVYNANDYRDVDILIGFNITRLWNF